MFNLLLQNDHAAKVEDHRAGSSCWQPRGVASALVYIKFINQLYAELHDAQVHEITHVNLPRSRGKKQFVAWERHFQWMSIALVATH